MGHAWNNGGGGAGGDDHGVSIDQELVRELIILRRNVGATAARISKEARFLLQQGKLWRRRWPDRYSDDAAAARSLLQETCEMLTDKSHSDLLLAEFGFTQDGTSRESRWRKYIDHTALNSNSNVGSPASFKRWSDKAIELVAAHIPVRTAGGTETEIEPSLTTTPFTVNYVHERHRFDEHLSLVDVHIEINITGHLPGPHSYAANHRISKKTTKLEIQPEFGCNIVGEIDTGDPGFALATLEFGRVDLIEKPFSIYYRLVANSSQTTHSIHYLSDYDTSHLRMQIEFKDDRSAPRSVWRYTDLTFPESQTLSRRQQEKVSQGNFKYLDESWTDLKRGLVYGLDWAPVDN